MLSVFFSLKCSLFHNSNLFGSCIIHILSTECAKIKKNNSGAKRLISTSRYELGDSELKGGRGLVIYFVNTLRLLIGNFCNRKCKPGSSDATDFSEFVEMSQQYPKSNHHMQHYFIGSGTF